MPRSRIAQTIGKEVAIALRQRTQVRSRDLGEKPLPPAEQELMKFAEWYTDVIAKAIEKAVTAE